MKRSPLQRKTPLRATSTLRGARIRYRKPERLRDVEAERRWYATLAFTAACQHPDCPRDGSQLVLHHVVYRQKVRREGGDQFDPRNALVLCDDCHASHHRRGARVVPLRVLSDANYAFAVELLGEAAYDYLQLRYAGDDPRLEALRCETT